jgi:cinnamoyl-CoA:phenyllactate CoA-transferase
MAEQDKLLAGVKVVELATFLAAATAGRFLADQGAQVIKIESAQGDPSRYTAASEGRPQDDYENTTWDVENTNKRSIALNTKDPAGKAALMRLLEDADVLITNWRVQALKKNGLDYETLKQRFPKLVYAMVTGYGEYGPDKDLPGFDFVSFFARGGYFETLREKEGKPFHGMPGIGDHVVGMNLVAGILAALYHAKMTGKGEMVETSLFESAMFNMALGIQAAQYKGLGITWPYNSCDGDNPMNAAFETKDGRYIQFVFPNYNTYFPRFIAAVGRPELADDPNYFPIESVQAKGNNPLVYNTVAEAMKQKTADEWKPILAAADVPFSKCQNFEELLEDPQAWANDCLCKIRYDNGNERVLVRQPVKFREQGLPDYPRGPYVGEHSVEILKEAGYSDEEIRSMLDSGAAFVWKDQRG